VFAASLVALLAREGGASAGARALFFVLIALALWLSAYWVERHASSLRKSEGVLGHVLFALGLLLWWAAVQAIVAGPVPTEQRASLWFAASAVLTALFELVGRRVEFVTARRVAGFLFISSSFAADQVPTPSSFMHAGGGLPCLAFAAAMSAEYWVLWRQRDTRLLTSQRIDIQHALSAAVLALFALGEAVYWTQDVFGLAAGWRVAACLLAPLSLVALAIAAVPRWPVAANLRAYRLLFGCTITIVASFAALVCQFVNDGGTAPLPYLPLLNPLDLAQALVLAAALLLARTPELDRRLYRGFVRWMVPLFAFVAINGTIVRTAHTWAGVPFREFHIPTEPVVQSAFSIVWTLIALLAMMVAHRRRIREVWVAGAVLLGCVVLKLFFVDLSQLSNVAKIVTFLAVGLLLLLIGFVAPVPPAERTREEPS
jgi:uncharacterized membrane protein